MLPVALSLLAGVAGLNLLSDLPGPFIYIALPVFALVWWLERRKPYAVVYRALTACVFGASWAQMHATDYLSHRLPEALAGSDVIAIGRVADIPDADAAVQRFIFDVHGYDTEGNAAPLPRRLRLSWYYGQPVRAGETWRLKLRLKPPHGFMNPGGFDYEAWLMLSGVHATGYVRDDELNRRLKTAALHDAASVRQRIAERIGSLLDGSASTGLVTALAVGDRSAITPQQWQVLIKTGTNHLVAISGLHIGLAAAFGFGICRRLIPARVMHHMPAQHVALLAAIISALIYAMLAGFAIPTQRALLMLLCAAGAVLLRRRSRPRDVLAFALIVVPLWDPASVMSAGFWFSFLAVAVIFYALGGRFAQSRWSKWVWIQAIIALALMPLSLFMFQQTSLVAPLANLVMVPFVSLLIVPLVLLGLLLLPLSTVAAGLLLSLAATLLDLIWPLVQWLAQWPYAHWLKAQPGILLTILALAGVGVMLAPRLRRWRAAGVLLLLPALTWQPRAPAAGAYELNVLDVGQGLAVVIRTHAHTLVYDTGARFSDRLDSGQAVVVPFLTSLGVDRIDLLLISHGDGDHIGGAASLLRAYPETPVLGQGVDRLTVTATAACAAGQRWIWDGVEFALLHPDDAPYPRRNNRSCVLKISGDGGSVLLAGDIEKKVENRLLSGNPAELAADILVAPHHGSNTSSSPAFIDAVSPQIVIFAAGYRNRYRFPTAAVVARYAGAGSQMYISGHSGAIRANLDPHRGIGPVRAYRDSHRRYWQHVLPKLRHDD